MWILNVMVWVSCACIVLASQPAHLLLATTAAASTSTTSVQDNTAATDITAKTFTSPESTTVKHVTSAAPTVSASAEWGCPAECACTSDLQQEYTCLQGALEVVAAPGDFLQVTCRELSALPVELPALPPSPAPSAGVAGCPPPPPGRGGWASVLARLGARDSTSLHVRDSAPLTGSLLGALPRLTSLTAQRSGPAPGELPALLAALPALRRLRLRQVAHFALEEDGFRAAPQLEELEVAMSEVGAVPAGAFRSLRVLRRLGLWGAGLRAVEGGALAGLVTLQVLELRGNSLKELPVNLLEDTPALLNLSLANNALQSVPQALHAAPALLSLDLSVNRIAALHRDDFVSLSHLRSLNLDNNLLEELSQQVFSGLSSLEEVSVRRNRLRHIAVDALSGAQALRRLALSDNRLSFETDATTATSSPSPDYWETQASPFNRLVQLQELDLSHNLLSDVLSDLRHVLLALRLLDLSHNRLQRLTDADVNFLSWNIVVDMRYNNISLVELSPALSGLGAGEGDGEGGATVLLQHNPLLCDCRLHELVRRVQQGAGAGGVLLQAREAACAAPSWLVGRALLAVPRAELTCSLPAPDCPPPCTCLLVPGAAVPALHLRCAQAPRAPAWPDPRRYGLQQTEVRLESAPSSLEELQLPVHVHTLRLPGLQLHALPGAAPASLALLDLRDNLLPATPPLLLRHNSTTRLLLAGNPLRCDCDHADQLHMLQQKSEQVEDWSQLQCWRDEQEPGNTTLLVSGVPASTLCVWRWAGSALALLGLLGALLVLVTVTLSRRYELPVRVWCAARGLTCCRDRGADRDEERLRPYDAFVSYSHEDEEWVLGRLVARLEGAEGRRLCVHFRDWVAGEYIPHQIARSVELSRRTIVVLSPAYLRSGWARCEWRAARGGGEGQGRGRGRVIVLLLGEVEPEGLDADLRAYLSTNTYVKVGDPWFWDKLLYALPPRRKGVAATGGAERDVARKEGFNDRLEELAAAAGLPGLKEVEGGALDVRLTPDGKLVNNHKLDVHS